MPSRFEVEYSYPGQDEVQTATVQDRDRIEQMRGAVDVRNVKEIRKSPDRFTPEEEKTAREPYGATTQREAQDEFEAFVTKYRAGTLSRSGLTKLDFRTKEDLPEWEEYKEQKPGLKRSFELERMAESGEIDYEPGDEKMLKTRTGQLQDIMESDLPEEEKKRYIKQWKGKIVKEEPSFTLSRELGEYSEEGFESLKDAGFDISRDEYERARALDEGEGQGLFVAAEEEGKLKLTKDVDELSDTEKELARTAGFDIPSPDEDLPGEDVIGRRMTPPAAMEGATPSQRREESRLHIAEGSPLAADIPERPESEPQFTDAAASFLGGASDVTVEGLTYAGGKVEEGSEVLYDVVKGPVGGASDFIVGQVEGGGEFVTERTPIDEALGTAGEATVEGLTYAGGKVGGAVGEAVFGEPEPIWVETQPGVMEKRYPTGHPSITTEEPKSMAEMTVEAPGKMETIADVAAKETIAPAYDYLGIQSEEQVKKNIDWAKYGFVPSSLQFIEASERYKEQGGAAGWAGGLVTEAAGGAMAPGDVFINPRTPEFGGAAIEGAMGGTSKLEFLRSHPVYAASTIPGEILFGKAVSKVGKGLWGAASKVTPELGVGRRVSGTLIGAGRKLNRRIITPARMKLGVMDVEWELSHGGERSLVRALKSSDTGVTKGGLSEMDAWNLIRHGTSREIAEEAGYVPLKQVEFPVPVGKRSRRTLSIANMEDVTTKGTDDFSTAWDDIVRKGEVEDVLEKRGYSKDMVKRITGGGPRRVDEYEVFVNRAGQLDATPTKRVSLSVDPGTEGSATYAKIDYGTVSASDILDETTDIARPHTRVGGVVDVAPIVRQPEEVLDVGGKGHINPEDIYKTLTEEKKLPSNVAEDLMMNKATIDEEFQVFYRPSSEVSGVETRTATIPLDEAQDIIAKGRKPFSESFDEMLSSRVKVEELTGRQALYERAIKDVEAPIGSGSVWRGDLGDIEKQVGGWNETSMALYRMEDFTPSERTSMAIGRTPSGEVVQTIRGKVYPKKAPEILRVSAGAARTQTRTGLEGLEATFKVPRVSVAFSAKGGGMTGTSVSSIFGRGIISEIEEERRTSVRSISETAFEPKTRERTELVEVTYPIVGRETTSDTELREGVEELDYTMNISKLRPDVAEKLETGVQEKVTPITRTATRTAPETGTTTIVGTSMAPATAQAQMTSLFETGGARGRGTVPDETAEIGFPKMMLPSPEPEEEKEREGTRNLFKFWEQKHRVSDILGYVATKGEPKNPFASPSKKKKGGVFDL